MFKLALANASQRVCFAQKVSEFVLYVTFDNDKFIEEELNGNRMKHTMYRSFCISWVNE